MTRDDSEVRRRGPRGLRGRWVISSMGAVGALASVSTVFACTTAMGGLTISPMSGPAGTIISATATGMKTYPAKYAMHLGMTTADDCMSFSSVTTLKTIRSNRAGGWTNVHMTIPATAAQGTHEICGMEVYPVRGATGTVHDTFTVT